VANSPGFDLPRSIARSEIWHGSRALRRGRRHRDHRHDKTDGKPWPRFMQSAEPGSPRGPRSQAVPGPGGVAQSLSRASCPLQRRPTSCTTWCLPESRGPPAAHPGHRSLRAGHAARRTTEPQAEKWAHLSLSPARSATAAGAAGSSPTSMRPSTAAPSFAKRIFGVAMACLTAPLQETGGLIGLTSADPHGRSARSFRRGRPPRLPRPLQQALDELSCPRRAANRGRCALRPAHRLAP